MLLKLRSGQNSFLVTILLAVLIASFVLVSGGGSFFGNSTAIVATVGNTNILTQEYSNRVSQRAQDLQIQYGGAISSADIIRTFQLDQQVLTQMMARASFVEASGELGLRGTPTQVGKSLKDTPAFLFNGVFSKDAMEAALNRSGITPRRYEELTAEDIATGQLLEAIMAPRPEMTKLAAYIYAHDTERRTADLISISAALIDEIATPTEEQLTALYEANKGSYIEPERRSYQYILLTLDQFMDGIDISEEDIAEDYDINLYDYVTPETRVIEQAIFADIEAATAFLARVNAGENFAVVAAEMTDFTEEEIALPALDQRTAETDFDESSAAVVFSLELNTPSAPLPGFAGFNVFQVTEITSGNEKSLDDVREEIRAKLSRDLAVDAMYNKLPDIEDTLSVENNLDVVAEKLGLTLASVDGLDNRGQNADGSIKLTTALEQRILSEAFSLEVGDLIDTKNVNPQDSGDGMYLVQVLDIVEQSTKPYEEVAETVASAWRNQERMNKAGELAEQALARLIAGETPEAIIDDIGGTSFQAKNVSRTAANANSGVSPNIRSLIFDLGEGESDIDRSGDNSGYMVVRVNEIKKTKVDVDSFEVAAMAGRMQGEIANELQAQYQRALWNRYSRTQNNLVIQQLFYKDQ